MKTRVVGLEFLSTAPVNWTFTADVDAPRAAVFAAIAADPSTWVDWFPGLDSGSYVGDGPHGAGSMRQVQMGDITYRETMLAWDEPERWAYRMDETSADLFSALVEDWRVEANGDHSIVRWTFAIEPLPGAEVDISGAKDVIGDVFAEAMANLSRKLRG